MADALLWFMVALVAALAAGCGHGETCGPGTHDSHGQCLADAAYEVRLPNQDIVADGISKVPVLAIGTAVDGTPATDQVVLGTTLNGAGTLSPPSFALGPIGTQSWFTPCSSTNPACTGTFQITLALASTPAVVLAKSWPLTLKAPTGVGSAAPCQVGGNVVFYDGDSTDYIHPGTDTITQAVWNPTISPASSPYDVAVNLTPSSSAQGSNWSLNFSTRQLNQPMAAQVYLNAERAPFASPGHPGIDIYGSGRGCNTITGKFQVEQLQVSGGALTSFTATFEQHCEGGASALRGCVHYGP
jgi:hypothetical protein